MDPIPMKKLRIKSKKHLKKCLETFSPEDKMILLLKYHDDAPIKDIANALNLSEA